MPPADVSVLIPCRNGEAFLDETLSSVMRQTLPPLEVVVVDDGSTDGTRAIADRYAPLVRVVPNDGRGVSAARTRAGREARGAFLQFLDADDLLAPRALEARRAALEATGAEIAISDWVRLVWEQGIWTARDRRSGRLPENGEAPDVAVLRGFWAPPAAVLYRQSICARIGAWSATLPVIQDARFLLDAGRLGGRFVHVPEIGAEYRQHASGSVSTRDPIVFWRDVLRNAVEVEGLWRASGPLDPARRSALADVYSNAARAGFTLDRALFAEAENELRRFPEFRAPRFLRAARQLTPLVGHSAARWLLAAAKRNLA